MNNIEVYDLECFPNFFSYTGKNKDTGKITQFYIYDDYSQLTELVKHLKTLNGQIGFNNINYDYPLLHYILNNYKEWEIFEVNHALGMIYEKSCNIIREEFPAIYYQNVKIPQLDLFRIWHFNNKSRMTSLKAVEIAINYHNVQDLVFEPTHIVQEDEINSIMEYNLNDVDATYEFYKITKGETDLPNYKGKDKLQLRKDIGKKYNINVMNHNDVKIGDEINKITYSKLSGKHWKEFKDLRTYRSAIYIKKCIADFVCFKSKYFNDFLDELKSKVITKTKSGLEYELVYGNAKYKFAQGGLHTENKPEWLKSDENYKLIDADVSSFYPATIINEGLYPAHLGEEWLEGYRETRDARIKAKKEGNKVITEALKLSVNGAYGKTNDPFSYVYDPLVTFSVTITGQLALLMLIEALEDNGIQIVQANTDGIVSKVPRDKEELYYTICKAWEKKTFYELEYNEYKQLIQTSVNDYLAETIDGKIKRKGDFQYEREIHQDPSMKIRAIALERYYIDGIPIKKTIENHKNIFDFCKRFKTSKGWQAYEYSTDGQKLIKEKLQKNIRYYISKNGNKLTKENINDHRVIDVEAKVGITVFNKYIEKDIKDYNIDYSYYISETNKIIYSIYDGQLTLF